MGIFGKPPDQKPSAPSPSPSAPAPAASHAPQAPTPSAPVRTGSCLIGPKTVIKGEVTGDEDVTVEGTIEGQVRISRDLRVASGGMVRATVEAQSVVVSGEVVGDCAASQRVEIQSSGRLTGNIRAPRIVIAEGAVFKGNSDMSSRKDERKDKAASI
jgi:cytoskeletal protein CcmA (bactofilin family)